MPFNTLGPAVLAARDQLKTGRQRIRQQHQEGATGEEVSSALADLFDAIVQRLFQNALEVSGDDQLPSLVALVAHGGYGRRDVAPFSDLDLMLLHAEQSHRRLLPLVQQLTQDICDSGLVLGHSLRTPAEACKLAMEDVTILTSLAESRLLAGAENLFLRFFPRLRRTARRRHRSLIAAIDAARQEERYRYGGTVFLSTPNLKRSYGGLRDVQLVRWIGFVRYGETDLQRLQQIDALQASDRQQLDQAHRFLLRLRHDLHFHAGRAQDVLDRFQQVRLAEAYGYPSAGALMPVERFMRDYFQHTGNVRDAAAHFLATARSRGWIPTLFDSLASRRIAGDFRLGPLSIGATRHGLTGLGSDLGRVLHLMELASRHDKRIDHPTWQAIRQAMSQRAEIELTGDVQERFLSLMAQPRRLGYLLRRLHELRVLEKIVPGISHARCLVQFNDYHKYTVDEHCLRAVEAATEFLAHPGPLGTAYRGLANKRTLHLALLLHDLGKGFAEDHSDVGARLAGETAQRLGLAAGEAEILRLLVQEHLLLSHLAQRRDIHDPAVVLELAARSGSPEVLRMLYVLSCADLAAVGPGALTPWKLELITQLYLNTLGALTGDALVASPEQTQARRQELGARVPSMAADPWWQRQIAALPPGLLHGTRARRIVEDLQWLRTLARRDAVAAGRYDPEYHAVEYTIGAYEEIAPGIFHRLTGVLTSQRMEILSAEIHTLADGLVLDRFYVHDRDFTGPPPPQRLEDISRRLVQSLKEREEQGIGNLSSEAPGGPFRQKAPDPFLPFRPPTRVRFDNNTSERFTILDIFTTDRMGLLYTITRLLYEFGLSVHMAKIGTHLDQVVDVFYVTDSAGNKLLDEQRLDSIRQCLLQRIPPSDSR